jgi:hypothetical protein
MVWPIPIDGDHAPGRRGDLMTPVPPLSEQEFAELAQGLVTDSAPRVFALLTEAGERADGWVAMWGLAFEDQAVLLDEPDHSLVMICDSAEEAHRQLAMRQPLRLIWSAAIDGLPAADEPAAVGDPPAAGESV